MLKCANTQVVFREFPNEVTLALNLSLCPNKCEGCHSEYLREDVGKVLDVQTLDELLSQNEPITCVGFMGGDGDVDSLISLFLFIKHNHPYLKIGWYSGKDELNVRVRDLKVCDYMKWGSYKKECGGLDKETTNQRMIKLEDNNYIDITNTFYKK